MRSALLEYLRNLTPQILLLSLALVSGSRLDLNHISLSGPAIRASFPFLLIMLTFLIAFVANFYQFLEKMATMSSTVETQLNGAYREGARTLLFQFVPILWKHGDYYFAKVAIALTVALAGSIAVFTSAVPTAVTIISNLGR